MKALAISVFLLFTVAYFSEIAHAGYRYHTNKRGTGYWRDSSNDGQSYNNANELGMNGRRGSSNRW